MFKKILIGFFILIFLIIMAVAVFIATFDAEKFRPLIESKLEEATGNPVSVGSMDLSWKGGIALEMKQLAIHATKQKAGEPLLAVGRAYAFLEPLPLLNKNLQIGSLEISGLKLHAIRSVSGDMVISGIRKTSQGGGGGALLPFLVSSLALRDSFIRFTDNARPATADLTLRNLNLDLKDVSLHRPWSYKIQAALFSEAENINASGKLAIPIAGSSGRLEDVDLSVDLGGLDIRQLQVAFPEIRDFKIPEGGLKGKLEMEIPSFAFSENSLLTAKANLKVSRGFFASALFPASLENLNLNARFDAGRLDLESFHMETAGGTLEGQGTATRLAENPQWTFRVQVRDIDLKKLQKEGRAQDPVLHGNLSAAFEGNAVGKTQPAVLQTLQGRGTLSLSEGVIVNMNILKEVFSKLSMIPGLMRLLRERLPKDYFSKLEAQDTYLGPVDMPFVIQNGFILLEQMNLNTDDFLFQGSGSIRLDGAASLKGFLVIEPQLSMAIIRSINELQNLTDQEGRLQIPVAITKQAQGPPILIPDLAYIGSRLVAVKAREWIGEMLGVKKPESQTPPPDPTSQSTSEDQTQAPPPTGEDEPSSPLEGLIGGLLQSALEKK